MDIRGFFHQISSWRRDDGSVSIGAHEGAQEAYQRQVERDLLKQGKFLLKRYHLSQEQIRRLRERCIQLQQEVQSLQGQMQQTVTLDSGQTVTVDCRQSDALQVLWKELEQQMEAMPLPEIPDADALLKQTFAASADAPLQSADDPASSGLLYNADLLDQESDDLLAYL